VTEVPASSKPTGREAIWIIYPVGTRDVDVV
jgi:hypothetical protein